MTLKRSPAARKVLLALAVLGAVGAVAAVASAAFLPAPMEPISQTELKGDGVMLPPTPAPEEHTGCGFHSGWFW